jgi:hypothetical protein
MNPRLSSAQGRRVLCRRPRRPIHCIENPGFESILLTHSSLPWAPKRVILRLGNPFTC